MGIRLTLGQAGGKGREGRRATSWAWRAWRAWRAWSGAPVCYSATRALHAGQPFDIGRRPGSSAMPGLPIRPPRPTEVDCLSAFLFFSQRAMLSDLWGGLAALAACHAAAGRCALDLERLAWRVASASGRADRANRGATG
jgi:hypothetical protein